MRCVRKLYTGLGMYLLKEYSENYLVNLENKFSYFDKLKCKQKPIAQIV